MDVFTGSLNIISIIFIFCGCLIGVLIGILLKPPRTNKVIKFLPNDKRFIEFDIKKEHAFSVYCKDKKSYPPHRFIKFHSGFTGLVGSVVKRASTIFLGIQGTAYTQRLSSGSKIVNERLDKCLRALWGDDFYDLIPKEQKDAIEDGVVLTTIDLGDLDIPKNSKGEALKNISEEDLKTEEDVQASQNYWKGRRQVEKGAWVQYVFTAGTGAAIMLVGCIMLGWIKIG